MTIDENQLSAKKQTLNDVLSGEEPTDEFLEEMYVLHNSSISDEEIERQAMEAAPNPEPQIKIDPSYKTSESSFSGLILIFVLLALLFLLLSCASASTLEEHYLVVAKFSRPGSIGESAMVDNVTASNREEAIEKYKRKLLDVHPDYEIKILEVCTQNAPRICIKY